MNQEFQEYCSTYNKNYANTQMYNQRRRQFIRNYRDIISFNSKKSQKLGYSLGVNQFADMSPQEYEGMLGFSVNQTTLGAARRSQDFAYNESLPQLSSAASINWTANGVVTPVRNQGQCGGCYAFSAAAALESAYAIKTGKLVVFSPQQYIDCSRSSGNLGCSSGNMANCYKFSQTNPLQLDSTYPYTAKQGTCVQNASLGILNTTGYGFVQARNP